MVWKILSGISAACLAVAAYFSFISKNDIRLERESKARNDQHLAEVTKKKTDAAESIKQKETQLATLTKDLEKLKADVTTAETEVQEKVTALELAKKNLDQTAQQLTAVEKKIEEAGDIEKLLAQVNALKKDKEMAEAEVATEANALAAAQERTTKLQADVEKSREVEARSRKGELDPEFSARIAQAFSDWGFAVLNKGNAGGVVANAELNVKRGTDIVAKLKVRNVEQAISVVDIVPGSLKEGAVLRTGDMVVPVPVVKKETPPPAPKDGAAPGAAPKAADPFGAPAPAPGGAPAGAPAMNADPFGAPPAAPGAAPAAPAPGAAPAAPAAADPFGAPPAKPAEAPPAAGNGTKAAPSTADPFAK